MSQKDILAIFDRNIALFVCTVKKRFLGTKKYTNRAFPICDKGFEGYEQACGKVAKCCGKLRKPLILQEKRVEISVESVENFFSSCRILHKNDQRAKLPQAVRWYISAFQ